MRADRGRHVALVVEDDALIRSDIVSEFSWQGWNVFEAESGEQALGFAKNNHVDLVITDINLAARMSGWDVADAVRNLQPDVAVVYTSGKPAVRSRLVQGGVFFEKPFDLEQIVDVSQRLCGSDG